jgi:hypothetical protein
VCVFSNLRKIKYGVKYLVLVEEEKRTNERIYKLKKILNNNKTKKKIVYLTKKC